MPNKILFVTIFCIGIAMCDSMTNNWGVYLAQINLNLPSTTFPFPNGDYIKLSNGVMIDHKGPFVGATLSPRIVNGDFNSDDYPDAAVILNVNYIGFYFEKLIFVLLQNYTNGPKVTNGVTVIN
jgi:hypothetical protein